MGRLIDETNLMNLLYALDDARHELFYAIKKIPELPTVEAIPKDQYEARLKADLVAMLTEIQLEIDEEFKTNIDGSFPLDGGYDNAYNNGLGMANQILKSKIDKLKENKDGSN